MVASRSDAPKRQSHGQRALEHIARELSAEDRTEQSFTPEVTDARRDLPGRKRGESLSKASKPAKGPGALILDCGTSRKDDFTHVLWVSHSAESWLGDRSLERLRDALGTLDGVSACEWEGDDHLHVQAPDYEHEDLLSKSRAKVAKLLS